MEVIRQIHPCNIYEIDDLYDYITKDNCPCCGNLLFNLNYDVFLECKNSIYAILEYPNNTYRDNKHCREQYYHKFINYAIKGVIACRKIYDAKKDSYLDYHCKPNKAIYSIEVLRCENDVDEDSITKLINLCVLDKNDGFTIIDSVSTASGYANSFIKAGFKPSDNSYYPDAPAYIRVPHT